MITVQHIADGDYRVTRGGDGCVRNPDGSVAPVVIKRDETISASQIGELMQLGVVVNFDEGQHVA